MLIAALIVANLALALAVLALARAGQAVDAAADAQTAARRHAGNVEQAVQGELHLLRSLIARLVGGEELTADMVREGILWKDVDAAEARRLIEAGEVALLDVRTPQETALGIIAGAQLVPMEQIEERRDSLPTGRPLLVYCEGGGRSAAVCEYLSREGHERLLNLTGGFGGWDGPVERP